MIRLHCGAETTNGLALCELCRRAADTYLEFAAIHFRNLARWRPGRAGSRPIPGPREPSTTGASAASDQISRTLDETGAELVAHANQLADDRPGIVIPPLDDEATQFVALCELYGVPIVAEADEPSFEWKDSA